jgi:hypothetical protein
MKTTMVEPNKNYGVFIKIIIFNLTIKPKKIIVNNGVHVRQR